MLLERKVTHLEMKLIVDRFSRTPDYTLGRLLFGHEPSATAYNGHVDRMFICFTLEDTYRPEKIQGKTRIPAGEYEIKLRPEGKKYQKYLARFGEWQKPGMLYVTGVPNFEWILIHPGNSANDTEGCLLVGNGFDPSGVLLQSADAYERIYKYISERMVAGERCFIRYEDNDI